MRTQISSKIILLAGAIMMAFAITSCKPDVPNSVSISADTVTAEACEESLYILSGTEWTISIYTDVAFTQTCNWISPSVSSGTGNNSNITLSIAENTDIKSRTAFIRVSFGDEAIVKSLTQDAKISGPRWMELPKVDTTATKSFVYHHTTIKNNNRRNFSMLYDTENRVALWVAYPLCDDYLGSTGRTDKWAYDPKISMDAQPTLNQSWGVSGYDRGHQLPSADRTCSAETNAATFYFSNMTVQNSSLNQGIWGNLEMKVRDNYAEKCDTLYVITGPVLKLNATDQIQYIKDRSGKKVAVPKAYFKVLLKFNLKDNTYSSIGFWYENKGYGYSTPKKEDAHPVTWIEEKTGITFFENLPENVSKTVKEEYKPADWSLN